MSTDPAFQTIVEQLKTILAFIERPVVQLQVLTLIIIIILAYFCAKYLGRLTQRFLSNRMQSRSEDTQKKRTTTLDTGSYPIVFSVTQLNCFVCNY